MGSTAATACVVGNPSSSWTAGSLAAAIVVTVPPNP
ncbi:Uncharacterised protein [Mycobacteroides abscessus subsp. abscessus]|nr:Uncharacterised protein [Mycobacteroides abscessus subsp. abscessus]